MDVSLHICGLRPVDLYRFNPGLVPLTFIKVNATINTFISVVSITQFYRNQGSTPIECEYVFPLDDNGVVTRLAVQFDDGRELTAQVNDKKESENRYNRAIGGGHTAVLARTNEPDKMILNIGNLPPNSRAKVTVVYTSPLSVVNE
jgi:Ca-activated chloride channel family protein